MALRRYSVIQVDSEGYDWYTLHTDDLAEALKDARERRQQEQAIYIYDNVKDRMVDEKVALASTVHPIFQGLFDDFLSFAASDTVNNGDTGACPICDTVGCHPENHGTFEPRQGLWFPNREEDR